MDHAGDAVKDFLRWVFTPTLAIKKALDRLDDVLAGESGNDDQG